MTQMQKQCRAERRNRGFQARWTGRLAALLVAGVCLTGALAPAPSVFAAEADGSSVKTVQEAQKARQQAKQEALSSYFVTKGKKLDAAVARLTAVDSAKTGLTAGGAYDYRMDKELTGGYFRHVRAYAKGTDTMVGDYLIAKDDSCVYRRYPGDTARTELLDGTTERLVGAVDIYAVYSKVPIQGVGKVFVRVPGNIPYKLTLTSLDENIARTDAAQGRVLGVARGKVVILAEAEIGGYVKTEKLKFRVIDEKDAAREDRSYGGPPISIGIGWGWGWGRDWDDYGGGVVIGI
ncbi:MAG: hypothetical protein ACOYKB_07485 [Succiniclasticum sp.]|jgi:hypothetical protein